MYVLNADQSYDNQPSWIDLSNQFTEAISFLTAALNIHLTTHQHLIINTSSIFIQLTNISIFNQSFEQIERSRISFPGEYFPNETIISFRVCWNCFRFFFFSFWRFASYSIVDCTAIDISRGSIRIESQSLSIRFDLYSRSEQSRTIHWNNTECAHWISHSSRSEYIPTTDVLAKCYFDDEFFRLEIYQSNRQSICVITLGNSTVGKQSLLFISLSIRFVSVNRANKELESLLSR